VAQKEEEAKSLLSDWDVVYLSEGRAQGIEAGSEYLVFRPGELVEHPATGEVLGQAIQQVGRLKVIASQDRTATARITAGCTEVLVGDRLVPFEEIPVPLTVYPDQYPLGSGDLVDLDLGNAQGIEPGDYLLIYREYKEEVDFFSTSAYIDPPELDSPDADQFPPNVLGQVVVIRANENTSTARIIRSAREIRVGDKVAKR
jgi:hypothetical protein